MMDNSVIFFLCALLPLLHSMQIHEHMTPEEVMRTFQTTHENVPEYEVAPIFHELHKRNAHESRTARLKVNALNRTISLYLRPTEGILVDFDTPVWTVEYNWGFPEHTKYSQVPYPWMGIGTVYQDPSKVASVLVYQGYGGQPLLLGNLQHDLVVRPLPVRLHSLAARHARSLENEDHEEGGFRKSYHHVIFRRHDPLVNSTHSGIKLVERERKPLENVGKRAKRSLPQIIYPQVLVIIDHSLFTALGKNIKEISRYVLAFWNAVDLRYRLLEEPRIRFSIAGVIISRSLGGTPYIDSYKRGTNELDADLALTAMSHYFYRESYRFLFSSYDLAVAMTHLDMCNIEFNGVCNPSTLGYAYEWGACNRSYVDRNTEAVGIVEDNGGFGGIIATAHEVAHLLGSPHDGLLETIECPGWDGYLMATALAHNENSFQWSNCSLKSFYEFLSYPTSMCLFNRPDSTFGIPRILPGKLMTLDQQCEKAFGTKACHDEETVCTALLCYSSEGNGECDAQSAAAEGSYCGKGKHCINGHCIAEDSVYVPYTLSTTNAPLDPKPHYPDFMYPPESPAEPNEQLDHNNV